MKTILLAGCNGQVGAELVTALSGVGRVIACDRKALDLADPAAIAEKIRTVSPSIVVNAAAYTAVDRAEQEPALAHAINADAPAVMAEEVRRLGGLLVHYSTDYVFDGDKDGAYTEEDTPNPLNVYGHSKLAGERAIVSSGCEHLIFRTSWVYGARGANFLLTMLRLAAERSELKLVDDQVGAPTWSRDIAQATATVLAARGGLADVRGLFHLSAAGHTTWLNFAQAIFAAGLQGAREPHLIPISAEQYGAPALRPRNSQLDGRRLREAFRIQIPDWQFSLHQCLAAMGRT